MGLFSAAKRRPKTAAVIVAAGESLRMGEDKITADLGGAPVILHTLLAFDGCGVIDDVVLVTRPEHIAPFWEMARDCRLKKLRSIVQGGVSRQQSVRLGVEAAPGDAELLCIHDGARPLVSHAVIADAVAAAAIHGAAAAAVPVSDTVKLCDEAGFVLQTPARERVAAVQTPQVFERALYLQAFDAAAREYSDDCQLVEAVGAKVALTRGERRNLKLTTPEDLIFARALFEEKTP